MCATATEIWFAPGKEAAAKKLAQELAPEVTGDPQAWTWGGDFDVLVTVDKRLPQQQNITNRPFGVVVLRARSNRLSDLLPLVPGLRAALSTVKSGVVNEVAG